METLRSALDVRYEGLRAIGKGGMAVVYAAHDRQIGRDVAIKALPAPLAAEPIVRERFLREAQMAARLNHPGIVPVYAVDDVDGMPYYVMGRVHGETLAARLLREPRPGIPFVARVLQQVAEALAYAHGAGVIHRDIKPDNILLDAHTGNALLTDFGIAHAEHTTTRLTQLGVAMGTPAFMSPEQAMGEREIDGRADVYSLGVVGYLMLAGRMPFDAPTSAELMRQRVQSDPFPLANYRADLPFAFVDTIMRAIARDPAQRWSSARMFADAVRDAARDAMRETSRDPSRVTAGAIPREVPRETLREESRDRARHSARDVDGDATLRLAGHSPDVHAAASRGGWWREIRGNVRDLFGGNAHEEPQESRQDAPQDAPQSAARPAMPPDVQAAQGLPPATHRTSPSAPAMVDGMWEQLASAEVQRSRYATGLRDAIAEYQAMLESWRALDATDRALVADPTPKAFALLERIASIATALATLAEAAPPSERRRVESKLAVAREQPVENGKRIALLERQLVTLDALDRQRDTLQDRMDRATIALRTLRLEVMRLRTADLGAPV